MASSPTLKITKDQKNQVFFRAPKNNNSTGTPLSDSKTLGGRTRTISPSFLDPWKDSEQWTMDPSNVPPPPQLSFGSFIALSSPRPGQPFAVADDDYDLDVGCEDSP